jgi:hypothetical protein
MLKYVGKDRTTDWLPGVPARDLTEDEAKAYPQAVASEFYVSVRGKRTAGPVEQAEEEASPAGPGEQE